MTDFEETWNKGVDSTHEIILNFIKNDFDDADTIKMIVSYIDATKEARQKTDETAKINN